MANNMNSKTNFLKRLDEALKMPHMLDIKTSVRLYEQEGAKERLISEQGLKPQEGIYYWFPLKNEWIIKAFWYEFYGNKVVHAIIWQEDVAEELAEYWNLENKLNEIKSCPYGLPRGRIFSKENKMFLWHGNDNPRPDWKEKVFKEFQLSTENTEIIEHPHEKPKQSHIQALKALGIPI